MSLEKKIEAGNYTGFINYEGKSLEDYKPKLLINDYQNGQKIISSIIKELNSCEEFFFSVAFITQSGVAILLNTLKELEEKNIKGKVLASQYLNFTNPKALEKLLEFKNIELRILVEDNFHAKGYIFKKKDSFSLIVGSSNLTQEALSYNKEWNIKVSSMEKGSLIRDTIKEFNKAFEKAQKVNKEWIRTYSDIYEKHKPIFKKEYIQKLDGYNIDKSIGKDECGIYNTNVYTFKRIMPNKMQVEALKGIEDIRKNGGTKALLISATGTGKTYLAAFDVKRVRPARFLFLVHRERILDQAIESFKEVIGTDHNLGKLCGNKKEKEVPYIFSTVQTMTKDDILYNFDPNYFNYIVLDETHRSGAKSYQKILNYFKPDFMIGMTATPERTDGYNIYQDFDYNIAYEIRLKKAMEENMVCPFHYFGVSEMIVNGKTIDDKSNFNMLVSNDRVNHIIEKIKFYGYNGDRVRGLIFCSTNNEARKLSYLFNEKGYRTIALSGSDSQEKREKAIERLEKDESINALDYIFTVDIFNEGVDVPCINQIVMLRPTQSVIIFVQQLGRGLRKNVDKEYLTVIDFIGNYKNNFLIPMALSGDRSYNKDTVRRYVLEGTRLIPGCSTINFEKISRKRIFDAIDVAKLNEVKLIKEAYKNLKYQIGRIPLLKDFEDYGSIDPIIIFDNKSLGSYYMFLKKYEDEFNVILSEEQEEIITFISKKLADGKRLHELVLLRLLIEKSDNIIEEFIRIMDLEYNIKIDDNTIENIINILTNNFISGSAKNSYKNCIFIEESNGIYLISKEFNNHLENERFKEIVLELIDFGTNRNIKYFNKRYKDTNLQLYQKYTYEDVCRLLNWEKSEVPLNIGGYKFDKKTKTFPVFINYEKTDDISHSINYEDRFISSSEIIAISKSKRNKNSEDVSQIYRAKEEDVSIYLFVRKNKDDKMSKEFYFLGQISAIGGPNEFTMKNTNYTAVEIHYKLHNQVREDLYEYFTQ